MISMCHQFTKGSAGQLCLSVFAGIVEVRQWWKLELGVGR